MLFSQLTSYNHKELSIDGYIQLITTLSSVCHFMVVMLLASSTLCANVNELATLFGVIMIYNMQHKLQVN